MQITDFHAKYYAFLLTQQGTGNSVDTIAATLSDASVDLLPHQIEAALFAFHNPFLKGVIFGDEVGLGKTIEAGLVIAQKWSEGKQKIIIVVPATLRRQWQLELSEKFFLPSIILDRKAYDELIKSQKNPFEQADIVITSYYFAANCGMHISEIQWDLAVIDEAHRIRNCYKDGNVIAKSLNDSLNNSFKLLLTATPLQNSLLELYGLVSFIDDLTFGDVDSFKYQYLYDRRDERLYNELADRVKKVCIRTLRRQVLEYIKYTNRIPITQEFSPTPDEQELYDKVSSFIQKDTYAMPYGQRHLIGLILWKLLASSTYAIAATLQTLVTRLECKLADNDKSAPLLNFDGLLDDEMFFNHKSKKKLTARDIAAIHAEIAELKAYAILAKSIKKNAKGDALLIALHTGFKKLKTLGAKQKAVIFTESRRTQEFIYELLTPLYNGKIVLYNGETKDKQSVVSEFESTAQIMIATESASEGLNLQFCSMVINYDLPWNPQRVEQRIGRCHRYGQKHDIVVINLLNKENIADRRVFELLSYKFQLFEGVFGASDTVLGIVEGVDFEKRIANIYDNCRTTEQIETAFTTLRQELDEKINSQMKDTKQKLLENFDEDVAARMKINLDDSESYLTRFENMLWLLTKHVLEGKHAEFDDDNRHFKVTNTPYYDSKHGYKRHGGDYYFDKKANISERYRIKCSLAQTILFATMYESFIHTGEVCFDLTNHKTKLSNLDGLIGKSGYLTLYQTEIIYAKHRESKLVFAGFCDDGNVLDQKQMGRLFDLSAEGKSQYGLEIATTTTSQLKTLFEEEQAKIVQEISMQNGKYFDEETAKLEKWSQDVKLGMERALRELDKKVAEIRQQSRIPTNIENKIATQEKLKALESKRNQLRMDIYMEQDKIDTEREKLIEETKKKLTQKVESKCLFTIKWRVE